MRVYHHQLAIARFFIWPNLLIDRLDSCLGDCSIIRHSSGHVTVIDVCNAKPPDALVDFSNAYWAQRQRGENGNFQQKRMINTRSDGMVIDVLNVADGQTGKGPILDRYHQIEKTLTAVWNGEVDVETVLQEQRESDPLLRRQRRYIQLALRTPSLQLAFLTNPQSLESGNTYLFCCWAES